MNMFILDKLMIFNDLLMPLINHKKVVPLLYMFCAFVVHVLCLCCTCSVPLLYMFCAFVVHVLCLCCTCSVPLLYMFCAFVVHVLCLCCTCSVPLLCLCCGVVTVVYCYQGCGAKTQFLSLRRKEQRRKRAAMENIPPNYPS